MDRPDFLDRIEQQFAIHPVVALLGPRQCGKTTLARMAAERTGEPFTRLDLEDPTDLALLANPRQATRSMHTAMAVLQLDELRIVYPGEREFPLAERIRAMGLNALN